MLSQSELTSAVVMGATLLDERMPGWASKINLQTLNIGDRHKDVLGQLYGDYVKGCEVLGFSRDQHPPSGSGASQVQRRTSHGFSTCNVSEVEMLTHAWCAIVRGRLSLER